VLRRFLTLWINRTFCSPTTDDAERDEIIHQKIRIFRWIKEEHLDIPHTENNESYFEFAQKGTNDPNHPCPVSNHFAALLFT
jgi:hypothetical protein